MAESGLPWYLVHTSAACGAQGRHDSTGWILCSRGCERRRAGSPVAGDIMREKLTIIVPTYNCERTLRRCLESAQWADEVLVVDSFSTDGTLDIARALANRVVQHEYENSAAQKNWIIPQAAHPWVMILDSDECIPQTLRASIERALSAPGRFDAFRIRRRSYFFGRLIRFSGWQNDWMVRLFRRDKGHYEPLHVHADVAVSGPVGELKGCLLHDPYENLSDYLDTLDRYTTWAAKDLLERGRRAHWYTMAFRPAFSFFRDYILRGGFLDGLQGLMLCQLSAFYVLVKYAKLWHLQKRSEAERG